MCNFAERILRLLIAILTSSIEFYNFTSDKWTLFLAVSTSSRKCDAVARTFRDEEFCVASKKI